MASHSPPNRVLNFYRNSTILLTGGTGFLGKVLLEKILRCLDVGKVFLLIRTKDNLKPAERLDRLLKDAVSRDVHFNWHRRWFGEPVAVTNSIIFRFSRNPQQVNVFVFTMYPTQKIPIHSMHNGMNGRFLTD